MGLFIEGKNNVKITFQESGGTMVDAHEIPALPRFLYLHLLRRKDSAKQLQIPFYDIALQGLGIGESILLKIVTEAAVAFLYGLIGQLRPSVFIHYPFVVHRPGT